jgi:outer membrane receptor protein involved in Fe transport
MHRGRVTSLRQALIGGVELVAICTGIAEAQEVEFSIPAQPLGQTLKEISRQTGQNILFTPESVNGLRAPALNGTMSADDAIARALTASGLEATPDGSGGFVVRRPRPKNARGASWQNGEQTIPLDSETVIVTGSRIPQTGLTSASPVVAVTQDELKFAGTTDVTTLVNSLPEVFASQNSNVSNGATGTDNINLRDLGPSRTLVLIDGARLMPGDPVDPAADVNTIPAALVDRIEVQTGGASAVYGSDALAGVVNFILRKNFEGIELDGIYSITQNDNSTSRWRDLTQAQINQGSLGFSQSPNGVWDGETVDTTLLIGVNSPDGKGNVSIYLGYRNMAAVSQQSREYSECTLFSIGPGDICSGSTEFNRWLSFDNLYAGFSPFQYFETGNGAPGSGRFTRFTGSPDQRFNFGPFNYFQRPDTRYTGGFFAHYDANKALEAYANLMFTEDSTVAQIAPSGLFFGSGTGPSLTQYTNCSNPYMTLQENKYLCGDLPGDAQVTINGRTYWNGAGNAAALSGNPNGVAGQANLYIGRRDLEGGDRQYALRHDSYKMQIGIKGDLDTDWSYNLYAQEGVALYSQESTGNFSASRAQNALEVDPVTGRCYAAEQQNGDPSCVPLDIFNGIGSISRAMLDYVATPALQSGWTEEKIVSGSMTGDLGAWGIKSPLAQTSATIVAGGEYRQEGLRFSPDISYQTGDIEGSTPVAPVPASGFDVREGFGEVQLPLVQDLLFIEDATLKGGYRYSSYSTGVGTSTWYGAAEWQPVGDLRLRASMQRAVRAPNVLELFTPHITDGFSTDYPGSDPCATITTGQCALVPNAGTSLLFCPASACNQQVGGNIHLRPETSDTRSFGVVITPTFLDGFTATIDYWNIDVTNYISTLPPAEILNDCYGPAATPDSVAYFCPFVHRSANGTLYGAGFVASDAINTGYLKTRGIDFGFSYQTDTADWWGLNEGTIALDAIGTWLDELNTEAVPVTPLTSMIASQSAYNCAGLYGSVCGTPAPKWRHKLRLTWSTPFDVRVSLQWRYIGATAFDANTSTALLGGGPGITSCDGGRFTVEGAGDCADARISSYSYFDLSGAWDVRDGVELRAGVNNIFDIEPPILSQSALGPPLGNGNTYTGMYDTLGRTIFVAATIKY